MNNDTVKLIVEEENAIAETHKIILEAHMQQGFTREESMQLLLMILDHRLSDVCNNRCEGCDYEGDGCYGYQVP